MNASNFKLDISQIKPTFLESFYKDMVRMCSQAREDPKIMKEYQEYLKQNKKDSTAGKQVGVSV